MYFDEIDKLQIYTDHITCITHRNPTARAASNALAVGIASAMNDRSVEEIVAAMATTAEVYEQAELVYKPYASHENLFERELLFTSDMIRQAYKKALAGCPPSEFFESCLGYEADEAVAAAVYIFVRHSKEMKNTLLEGVHIPGNCALIGSIAAALSGAYSGVSSLLGEYQHELEMVEERNLLLESSRNLFVVLMDIVPVIDERK